MSPIKRMETIISNDEAQYIAVQDIKNPKLEDRVKLANFGR